MVLGYKHQNVVDINLNLLHKLHFKDNIIVDILFLRLRSELKIQVIVDTCVVLHINSWQNFIPCKIVKGGEDIAKP